MTLKTKDIVDKFADLPEDQRQGIVADALQATAGLRWLPNPGPQTTAYFCPADLTYYGGQAAGGKSDLLIGLALGAHRSSLIVRRQYTDLSALIDRTLEAYGSRKGYNGSIPPRLTTADGRIIDFGACARPGDEQSWQGRPHDLLSIDEAAQLQEGQVRYLDPATVAKQNAIAPLGSINSPETRRRFYARYFQQVRCVRKALQEFFEGVQQIGVYDDATIIVHGDHGSRITLAVSNRMYADLLTDDDFVDDYSTLFAVYGRGFDRGYDTSFRSVQALFAELFLQRTLTQEPTDVVLNASLHIGDWDYNQPWMRAPMPFFGASSAAPPECDSVSDCKPLVEPTAQ